VRVLVTGGAGFIGSHTCVALLEAGHAVAVIDNLCNSSAASLERVRRLAAGQLDFVQADVRDGAALDALLAAHPADAAIHFAGLKSVAESVERPGEYDDSIVGGTRSLCAALERAGVRTLVYSSSATVYGAKAVPPLREDAPVSPVNPYGRAKLNAEKVLGELHAADARWRIACLRYFNPAGAHPSGQIGEEPRGVPANLMPYVTQVALGRRERLKIWGGDYPTRDGTGVRDYIHVMDLAQAHVAALERLAAAPGCLTLNIGTGRGYSVLELVRAFEVATGRRVPYEIGPRRAGDVAENWADVRLAAETLGWRATRGLDEMCADAWRWQSQNPQGYSGAG
jgi:UDP-glucose 4-epimerase